MYTEHIVNVRPGGVDMAGKTAALAGFLVCIVLLGACENNFYELASGISGFGFRVMYDENGADAGAVPVDDTVYAVGALVRVHGNPGGLEKAGHVLVAWSTSPDDSGIEYPPGRQFSMGEADVLLYARWTPGVPHSVGGVGFLMVHVPGWIFPTGENDDGEANPVGAYYVSETIITYELWETVRSWAVANQYTFLNDGQQGGEAIDAGHSGTPQHPVTKISWQDAVVWCNALTAMHNALHNTTYQPAYEHGGLAVTNAGAGGATWNTLEATATSDGFRLLDSLEWERAARYQGDSDAHGALEHPTGSGNFWTPGSYASGAMAAHTDEAATRQVAWYNLNAAGSTHPVKELAPNALWLYDMSGNVREWTDTREGTNSRIQRGGSFLGAAAHLQVGWFIWSSSSFEARDFGFRVGRTAP